MPDADTPSRLNFKFAPDAAASEPGAESLAEQTPPPVAPLADDWFSRERRALRAAANVARIAPTPKQIIRGLDALRQLNRLIDAAEIFAFDAADKSIPADTLAALAAAQEKLAEAESLARREIIRLRNVSRGVAFRPQAAPMQYEGGLR